MIFGRRSYIDRSNFFHQLAIYGIAWLYRLVLIIDSFYRSIAVYRKTIYYNRFRQGRWGAWIPSVQRWLQRIDGFVDDLIVAQGLSAEKLIGGSSSLNRPQRGLAILGQIALAFTFVFLSWLNWPSSVAAPVRVVREGTAEVHLPAEQPAEAPSITHPGSLPEPSIQPIDGKPDVRSLLDQVTENSRNDVAAEEPLVHNMADFAPLLDQLSALQAVFPAEPEAAQFGADPDASADTAASVAEMILATIRSRAAVSADGEASTTVDLGAGETAAIEPPSSTESSGTLVVVEPQIQPSDENEASSAQPAPTKTAVPLAAEPAPPSTYPWTLALGSAWETFTPAPPSEIDHYWLGAAFPSGYNQFYSPSYQFGSTAGGRYRPHHGVDIANPTGSPVIAMAAGEVIHAGPDNPTLLGPYNNFYGNSVVTLLDHKLPTPEGEKAIYLLYGHLSEVHAVRGQRIAVGEPLGAVGMTGIAIGPHLHVEVRVGQNSYMTAVNPVLWIRPEGGMGSVAVRLLNAEGRTWAGAKVSLLRYEGGSSRWFRTIETYRNEERLRGDPVWGENGAMSNLPAGNYYIAAEVNGEKVGQNIVVNAGQTTFVELRTQQ